MLIKQNHVSQKSNIVGVAGDICGYLISSVSSVPFDVLMTDGREGVIYVKEGETFDLSTNSQYHFDVLPYTCSSGKHLNRLNWKFKIF